MDYQLFVRPGSFAITPRQNQPALARSEGAETIGQMLVQQLKISLKHCHGTNKRVLPTDIQTEQFFFDVD